MGFNAALDLYNIPPLAAAVLTLGLGTFVLIKRPDSPLSRVFAVFSLCLSGWNFGLFMMFLPTADAPASGTREWAATWDRCLHVALIYLAPVALHFILIITHRSEKWLWRFLVFAYGVATVFMVVALWWPNTFISQLYWLDWLNGYYPVAGQVSKIFDLFLVGVLLLGICILWHGYRTASDPPEKNRLKLVLFGGVAALAGGACNVALVRGLSTGAVWHIYPLGHITNVVFALVLTYAIVKHRLMDINVLIRRGLAYGLLAGLWTGTVAAVVFGLTSVLGGYGNPPGSWEMALVLGILFTATVIFHQPVVSYIQNTVDHLLFPTVYDYRQALTRFGETLRTELDIHILQDSIVSEIADTMGIERTALLLRDPSSEAYPVVSAAGVGAEDALNTVLNPTDPLLQALRSEGREILRAEVEGRDPAVEGTMRKLDAALCVPLICKGDLVGTLALGEKISREVYNYEDLSLLSTVAGEAAIAIENATLYDQMQEYLFGTIEALAAAVEAKDAYTSGHCRRVAEYAVMIGREMNLPPRILDALRAAGILHDVGKIGVPDQILTKQSALLREEFDQIKRHPDMGVNILGPVGLSPEAIVAVRHHHERVDGTGYPVGLSGEDIPLVARILAVADAFEAMTSNRAYRAAMSEQMAISELIRCAGTQFDVKVVQSFLRARDLRITGDGNTPGKEDKGPRLRTVEAA